MSFEQIGNALLRPGSPISPGDRLRLARELIEAKWTQRGLGEKAKKIAVWEKKLADKFGFREPAQIGDAHQEEITIDDARLVTWHKTNGAEGERAHCARLLGVATNKCLIVNGIRGAVGVAPIPYKMTTTHRWTEFYVDPHGNMGKAYVFLKVQGGPGVDIGTGSFKRVIGKVTEHDLLIINETLDKLEKSGRYQREGS